MTIDFSININGLWRSMDNYGDCPAMTYQLNNFSEFKDRNTEYSQTVKLPKSPANMRALGLYLVLDAGADLSKNSYRCVVLADGSRITPIGSVFQVTALTQDDIEGQILGPGFDLVDILNNKECSSSEDEGFWWNWWTADPANFYLPNGLEGVPFVATWAKNMLAPPSDAGIFSESGQKSISVLRLFPALPLLDLVMKIFQLEGWGTRVRGDFLTNLYESLDSPYCVVCNPIRSMAAMPYYADIIFYATYEPGSTNTWGFSELRAAGYPEPEISSDKIRVKYTAIYAGVYNLSMAASIDGEWFEEGTETFRIRVSLNLFDENGANYASYSYFRDFTEMDAGHTLTIEELSVELGVNHYYEVSAQVTLLYVTRIQYTLPGSAYVYITTSIEPDSEEGSTEPVEGVSYDLLNSMNFSNRGEIISEFLRLMGATLYIDSVNQTVYLLGMDYYVSQCAEGKAVDWTGKLVSGGEDWAIKYAPDGYARKNNVMLKDDEDNGLSSKWSFSLLNEALDESKDLWTSKGLALGAYDAYSGDTEGLYVNYPLVEVDRDTGEESWKGTNDILFVVDSYEFENITCVRTSGEQITKSLSIGRALRLKDFMPEAYGTWRSILAQYKSFEAYFMLTPLDIEALDLMKPVWLGEFGHYFYVSKISNYQPGKLTKVTLILVK